MIFTQIENQLFYEASNLDAENECIYIKLSGNRDGAARSHFERLVSVAEWNTFRATTEEAARTNLKHGEAVPR